MTTKAWENVSAASREIMREMGNFGPVTTGDMVKGYGEWGDEEMGKVYLDASDLRAVANACLEVAAWLEAA